MRKQRKLLTLAEAHKSARDCLNSSGEIQVVYHQIEDDSYLFCAEWVWNIFVLFGYPKSEFYCLITY